MMSTSSAEDRERAIMEQMASLQAALEKTRGELAVAQKEKEASEKSKSSEAPIAKVDAPASAATKPAAIGETASDEIDDIFSAVPEDDENAPEDEPPTTANVNALCANAKKRKDAPRAKDAPHIKASPRAKDAPRAEVSPGAKESPRAKDSSPAKASTRAKMNASRTKSSTTRGPPPKRPSGSDGQSADRPPSKRARIDAPSLPSPSSVSLPPPRKALPPHQLILAPMVGGSELAFRLLARRHGAHLCYTPMIRCEEFSKPGAGVHLLEQHADDAPLVAHFSGNDPKQLLHVAHKAERVSGVVAIDLNLGCPQRSAHSGHFGAFLCDPVDRKLLLEIVATLSRGLRVPFFCKIRLLDDFDDTLAFVRQLQAAGCALLTVHGRYRGSPMHRRDGAAHLDQVYMPSAQISPLRRPSTALSERCVQSRSR